MTTDIDVPIFKKCCFCIPLRPGLLVWGYLKLLATLFLILLVMYQTFDSPVFETSMATIIIILMCVLMIDLVFIITFLVGAHRKHEELIRVYYKFSIVLLILNAVLGTGAIIFQVVGIASIDSLPTYIKMHALFQNVFRDLIAYLLDAVLQGYLLMLIRSQLFKLRDYHNVEYVSNSATNVTIIEKK